MTKKTSSAGNQVAQVELTEQEQNDLREKMIKSLHRRVENKNWREIAEGIYWCIEQVASGSPQPDPDPVYDAPRVGKPGEGMSLDMAAVEAAIRKIMAEQQALKDTSPE